MYIYHYACLYVYLLIMQLFICMLHVNIQLPRQTENGVEQRDEEFFNQKLNWKQEILID